MKPEIEPEIEQFESMSKDRVFKYCSNQDCRRELIRLRREGAGGTTTTCPNPECFNHLKTPIENWKQI